MMQRALVETTAHVRLIGVSDFKANAGTYMVETNIKIWQGKYPLSPACATIFAKVCNAITRQPIELESCSNHLRIQQVFWLRL